jgi:hypothetical protein
VNRLKAQIMRQISCHTAQEANRIGRILPFR